MENSKPQWIRLGDALAQCEKASGDEGTWPPEMEDIQQAIGRCYAYQSHLNKYLSEAGASRLLIFKGVKITDEAGARNGPMEIVLPEYFRLSRTFVPQRHEIDPWSGSEPMDDFFAARKLGERLPRWLDVIVERAAFEAWLPVWLEKWLAEAVKHGWRTQEEATAFMHAAGMAVTPAPSATGAPGRPSSMHLIKAEFERRRESGLTEKTLAAEVRYLGTWLRENYPDHPPAKEKTISNKMRQAYRQCPQKRPIL